MNKKIAVLTSGWSVDYVQDFLNGMKQAALDKDVDIYVFCCYRFFETDGEPNITGFTLFDLIEVTKFDGIVIMPNLFNDDKLAAKWLRKISSLGIPAVVINRKTPGFHNIYSENYEVYKNLVLHLINDHHYTDFAFIGGPENDEGSISNLTAFLDALKESNISIDKSMLFLNGDWTYDFGREQAEKIFSNSDHIPQAVICANDWAAMATIEVAAAHSYAVPGNIRVVGFDNVNFSDKIIPSITSVSIDADKMGKTAVDLLINIEETTELQQIGIPAYPIYRQSCGCQTEISHAQVQHIQSFSRVLSKEQRFASQIRHMENNFVKQESLDSLHTNLQNYFEKRHYFEGSDFAILINKKVVDTLNEEAAKKRSTTFDKFMQPVVHIKNDKIAECKMIPTEELIPVDMRGGKGNLYFFLPIFHQKFIHGYYVSKNYIGLLENKRAYNWTRNFGAIIEKFRQTAVYRIISDKLRILSTQDSLSGVLNRSGLESYATTLFKQNNDSGKSTMIIFIDINNMKIINDRYGHLQGDFAVKTVADTIQKSVPADYLCIRYGGDEFVIVGTVDDDKAPDYISKINRNLDRKVERMTLPHKLSVSCGAKTFAPDSKASLKEAIKEVDEIMYEAKMRFHQFN